MPQGIKKINSAARFNALKKRIAKEGVTAVHNDTGYSLRTVKSINAQPDFETWRAKRDAQQAKRKHKSARPAIEPVAKAQAIQPIAPNQSVTTPDIKKPGHGRAAPQKSVSYRPATHEGRDQFFVTREQHERDMRNMTQLVNRANDQIGKVGKEVQYLLKEDTAYKQADIVIADKASKSWWTGVKERFGR